MFHRMLNPDDALVATPVGIGILAQVVDPAGGHVGPPMTIVGGILALVGLLIRLHYGDRADSRREKVSLLESDNTRLVREVGDLKAHNEIVVKRSDVLRTQLAARPCDVLVVEDSDPLATQMTKLLRSAGHGVRRVDTIASAISEFDHQPPDVLVFDLKLADGDGELVFDHALGSGVPFRGIVVTGEPNEVRLEKLRSLGVRVIEKPVDRDVLLSSIRPLSPPDESGPMPVVTAS